MVIIFIAISVFMVHKNTVTKKQRIELYREIYMHVCMYIMDKNYEQNEQLNERIQLDKRKR